MVFVVWFLVNSWSSVLFPIQIFFFQNFKRGICPWTMEKLGFSFSGGKVK